IGAAGDGGFRWFGAPRATPCSTTGTTAARAGSRAAAQTWADRGSAGSRGSGWSGRRARRTRGQRGSPVDQRDQAVQLDAVGAGVVGDAGPRALRNRIELADAVRVAGVPVAVAEGRRNRGGVLGGGGLRRLCHVGALPQR